MTQQSGAIAGLPVPGLEAPDSNDQIQLFDFSVNLLQALLWQYNEASNLQGLLQAKSAWYNTNQTQFWTDWHTNIFNLETANQFGLYVWSIILGLPIYVNQSAPTGPVFGFDNATGFNFDNGIFGGSSSYVMPLAIQRIALQLRYFQLTSSGTVPEINRMLKFVFGGFGQAWLNDNHDMTQTYIFNFPVTYDLRFLFSNFDILPRPAGVSSTWVDATLVYFGFAPNDYNFDNGIFGG